jgi:hypothetical protein
LKEKEERKKENSNVATCAIYGVASFSSWFKPIRDSEMGITRMKGPLTTNASFEGGHLEHG